MFATAVRFLAKKSKGRDKPAGMNVGMEGLAWSERLRGVLQEHGPLTVGGFWLHAQGMGLKSKRHMKLILNWMRGQNHVKLICNHIGDKRNPDSMEFLYTIVPPRIPRKPVEATPTSDNSSSSIPPPVPDEESLRQPA